MGFGVLPWTKQQLLNARGYVPNCHYNAKGQLVHNETGKQYVGGRAPKRRKMSLGEYRALMAKVDPNARR